MEDVSTKTLWSKFIEKYLQHPLIGFIDAFVVPNAFTHPKIKELIFIVRDDSVKNFKNLPMTQYFKVLTMLEWVDMAEEERSKSFSVLEPSLTFDLLNYLVNLGVDKGELRSKEITQLREKYTREHDKSVAELEREYQLRLSELQEEMAWKCEEKLNKLAIKKNREIENFKLTAFAWKRKYDDAIRVLNLENETPLVLIALLRLYRKVPKPYKSLVSQIHFYTEKVLKHK